MSHPGQAVLAKDIVQSEAASIQHWLGALETALRDGSRAALTALFSPDDCHWRDLLAFTWSIKPHEGADNIVATLLDKQASVKAHGFAIAADRTQPRRVQRAGVDVIEAIFEFRTVIGRGYGVVRLLADQPSKAWMLMTSLHELKGFEEHIGKSRPTGAAYSRNFGGMNWKDLREKSQRYDDRDPVVLVVGGGQAGLNVAARLGQMGVDTLVIDRLARIGDCWRHRYHSLALHNHTDVNHMPYMPFPDTWPKYLPKDMIADWFEDYAWALEINFWTGTELISGNYDQANGVWNANVRQADGTERTLHPRHVILANGIVGFPSIPKLPGIKDFKGDVMHTSEFTNGANWRGKKALVLGTGNSGHDVAQDLHSNGVDTTIVQRGSTTVISISPSAKLVYGAYDDGTPVDDADLIVSTNTLPVTKRNLKRLVARMVELDKDLIEGLIARGFKWDIGEDKTGHQMKIRTRFGGYYLNAGCSDLIIKGEVGLLQYDQIEKFVGEGALLKDGSIKPADLVVLATGYVSQKVLVGKLFGEVVAERVGEIWGIDPDGEMNNMWKRTAQEGLWFVGSGFAQCRQFSRFVALQIKAIEEGLLSKAL